MRPPYGYPRIADPTRRIVGVGRRDRRSIALWLSVHSALLSPHLTRVRRRNRQMRGECHAPLTATVVNPLPPLPHRTVMHSPYQAFTPSALEPASLKVAARCAEGREGRIIVFEAIEMGALRLRAPGAVVNAA